MALVYFIDCYATVLISLALCYEFKNIESMFKIGQKVVCIAGSVTLKENEIYTIKEILLNGEGVTLFEVVPLSGAFGFHSWRFREIETDWVEKILLEILEEVESEELIFV